MINRLKKKIPFKTRHFFKSRWSRFKMSIVKSYGKLRGAHIGYWCDAQGIPHMMVSLGKASGNKQLTTFLWPGTYTDNYFPAPASPQELNVKPFPRGSLCYRKLSISIKQALAAKRKLVSLCR